MRVEESDTYRIKPKRHPSRSRHKDIIPCDRSGLYFLSRLGIPPCIDVRIMTSSDSPGKSECPYLGQMNDVITFSVKGCIFIMTSLASRNSHLDR